MGKLKTPTIGKIRPAIAYDGTNFVPVLCDSSGHIIAIVGNDGTTYRPIKVNASGQVEMVVSGKVPDSDLLDGYDSGDFVKKAGDTMTGYLTLAGAPTADLHAATKKYVDDHAVSPGTLLKNVWCPDAPPANPNAKDDEFDDQSFNSAKWTEFDPDGILTTSEIAQGACLESLTASNYNIVGQMQPVSDADFTMWTAVTVLASVADVLYAGLALWEDGIAKPTTSDIVIFGMRIPSTDWSITVQSYTSYNTWSQTLLNFLYTQPVTRVYLRVVQLGNSWNFHFSTDGLGWAWKHSMTRSFIPKQVGIFIQNRATGVTARAIFSFFRFLDIAQSVRSPTQGNLIHLWG